MNNLTKEKKQQLAVVAIFTAVILVCILIYGVNDQKKRRAESYKKAGETKERIAKAEKLLKQKDEIQDRLDQYEKELASREAGLPNFGGAFQWMINTVNEYIKPPSPLSNFNIPLVPASPSDVLIIPKFDYKAAVYGVTLTGYYLDFGKFLADFENDWPYLRVQNLRMEPASAVPGDEKLNFQFEIVSLTLTNKTEAVGGK